MELLEPFLRDFPKDIQRVRAILQKLWSGQIFYIREVQGGRVNCVRQMFLHVGKREDHLHLFKQCPILCPNQAARCFSTFLHGVLVYSPEAKFIVNGPKNKKDLPVLPP